MEKSLKEYRHLHAISRHSQLLKGISHLLEWDQETYMPPAGGEIRGQQLKMLAGMIHREKTGAQFTHALEKLVDLKTGKIIAVDLDPPQQAALREWRLDYIREIALPAKFVEEFAQLSSEAQLVWRKAKEENQFALFMPWLEKIIQMNRQKADLLGYKEHPYDALLDLYEPKITTSEVEALFADLKHSISTLVKKIQSAPRIEDGFLFGAFDLAQQNSFGKLLLDGMGYTKDRCRMDISTHPFSSSLHPKDHRITTRIYPHAVMSNISALLHEGGHALYEMGLPAEHYGSPLGEPISLGMHESQSRWWETLIGQSNAFWKHYYPLLQLHFKGQFDAIPLEDFYKGINRVSPSLIRVEADEVTYPLHVILRFEMEKALIEGSLDVRDIPEVWNGKMEELLGIRPTTDTEGCLQDIHWSMGAFGYFPTYALGNLYAAQMFTSFQNDHPDWQTRLSAGDLIFIKNWLHQAVHRYGRQYTSQELLKKITHHAFTAKPYIKYLNGKYGAIYGLSDG